MAGQSSHPKWALECKEARRPSSDSAIWLNESSETTRLEPQSSGEPLILDIIGQRCMKRDLPDSPGTISQLPSEVASVAQVADMRSALAFAWLWSYGERMLA